MQSGLLLGRCFPREILKGSIQVLCSSEAYQKRWKGMTVREMVEAITCVSCLLYCLRKCQLHSSKCLEKIPLLSLQFFPILHLVPIIYLMKKSSILNPMFFY